MPALGAGGREFDPLHSDQLNLNIMDKILISGITYDIRYLPTESMNGLIGTADFNRQLISINSDHTEQTKKVALIHEVLHIISETYGLDLSEHQVKILTHGVISVLSENKNLEV